MLTSLKNIKFGDRQNIRPIVTALAKYLYFYWLKEAVTNITVMILCMNP